MLAYKVALVRPPGIAGLFPKRVALGIASICAFLRDNGFECRIFDAHYHSWHEDALLKRLTEYRPHLMGFTAMTHEIRAAARIAERAKCILDAPAVIGGHHASALPRKVMDEFPAFDYGVYGEGEQVFLDLARRLRDLYPDAAHEVGGLIYRDGNETTINARPPLLTPEELSALPLPAMNDYFGKDPAALKGPDACYSLLASRGSSHSTCFDMRVPGRSARYSSAARVVEEMERAIACWGAHTFEFHDEMLFADSGRVRRLLHAMFARKLPGAARWSAAVRVDHVNPATVSMAAKAGCHRLDVFVGSGDDAQLDSMCTGMTAALVKETAAVIRRTGIKVNARFVLGYPNDTVGQARRTVGLARELGVDSISIDLAVPYPGTPVHEMALRNAGGYRMLSEEWPEYHQHGRRVMEIRGLPGWRLGHLRRVAILGFYLKNLNLAGLANYLYARRSIYAHRLRRLLGIKLVTKEGFTG